MASVIADTFKVLIGLTPDEKTFNDVENKIKGLSNTLASLGKAGGFLYFVNTLNNITQKIVDATQATAKWAVEMERVAKKSGVSSQVMQRLQILEQQKGLQQGVIANGLQSIADKQAKARSGYGVDQGFFRAGIDVRQGTPAEIMQKFIDKFANAPLWKQRMASQQTGLDMSLLELKGADIRNIPSSMIFDEKQTAMLDAMNQKFGVLNSQWQKFKDKLVLLTMPLVEKLLDFANKHLEKLLKQLEDILNDQEAMKKIETVLKSTIARVGMLVLNFLPMLIGGLVTILQFLKKFTLISLLGKTIKNVGLITSNSIKGTIDLIGTVYKKLTPLVSFLSGKLLSGTKLVVGYAVKGLGWVAKALMMVGKRVLMLTAQILASPITWVVGGLTAIGAIIADLVSYAITGEAKISKGLLEFTQKYFPSISKWVEKIHTFMDEAGQGMMESWEALKVIFSELWNTIKGTYDYGKQLVEEFFANLEEKFGIFKKMQNAVENIKLGWGMVTGDTQKMLKEEEAKLIASQERLNSLMAKKRTKDALAYYDNLIRPENKRMSSGVSNEYKNNVTVNNTNNFSLDGSENPEKLSSAITQKLTGASFQKGLNTSGILFGNGGR